MEYIFDNRWMTHNGISRPFFYIATFCGVKEEEGERDQLLLFRCVIYQYILDYSDQRQREGEIN